MKTFLALRNSVLASACLVSSLFLSPGGSAAQTRVLAWADEFDGPAIDRAVWKFGKGWTNDNIHYYTDRVENARIAEGRLQLVARREPFQGAGYTSALLETGLSMNWKYGRIEARIKLPGANGLVPAFWMLPADQRFGWWPESGEVDIMEYPTTQGNTAYGTVHTGAHNSISGDGPRGGTLSVTDAESAFHVYAAEWTGDQIDFFVDDRKYYTYRNDRGGAGTWPFDQRFYVILNLAVGGGWVGDPDASAVFPAVMEVDYVRVYQYRGDLSVNGPDFLPYWAEVQPFSFPALEGASYTWTLPGRAVFHSGSGTPRIDSDWNLFGGAVRVEARTPEGTLNAAYPVEVSENLLRNPGFEKGVKYWNAAAAAGAAEMRLESAGAHGGTSAARVHVKTAPANAWDVQISQGDLSLKARKRCEAGFWAKTDGAQGRLNAAVISLADFSVLGGETFTVTGAWTRFEFGFTPRADAAAGFNIDLGAVPGVYHLDDFMLTTPDLSGANQLANPDFEKGDEGWLLNSFGPAQAARSTRGGEAVLSIDDGGANPWDVHLGQTGVAFERGREYTVSFDAYADSPRALSVVAGKNADPWTIYCGTRVFPLTTERRTFTFTFLMNEPTDPAARFGFDAGGSAADVFLDNVLLSGGAAPSPADRAETPAPDAFELLPNYPNPFNPSTTIRYRLDGPSEVSLKILDAAGRETAVLAEGFRAAGTHQVRWSPEGLPSGVYLARLQAGGVSRIRKILLQK